MSESEADPLLDLFRAELSEQLTILRQGFDDLEIAPKSLEPFAAMADAAHTIRGAARLIRLDPAAQIAIQLEETLESAKSAKRGLQPNKFKRFRKAVDTLALLAEREPATWTTECANDISSLIGQPSAEPAPSNATPIVVPSQLVNNTPVVDSSLLELFREEARVHAAALSSGLLELERDSTNPQRIEPLMRAAHSLKGAARIVGLDLAVRLAHELEDAFVAAQAGRIRIQPADIDLFLRGADQLAALSEGDLRQWAASRQSAILQLCDATAALARGESSPTPSPSIAEPIVVASIPESPAPSKPATNDAPAPAESVVRVTAQSLNRLMSLAGESLVQARWLQPFSASLLRLKKYQDLLAAQLDTIVAGSTDANSPAVDDVKKQAAKCRQLLSERIGEFEEHAGAAEDLNTRLYREVIVSRMRPFADGAHAFPRLVRDTARSLGKQARLDVVGASTEVDRDILEKLEAPLTHLLRNSVDHGLESTEARVKAGKLAEGVVRIEARHSAGMLAISVSDDGAGINVESIRAKVIDRRLAPADLAARMSESEVLEFLFLPGFSTAGRVTEVSGRGVGLDVVLDTVRKVGGSVRIATQLGQGTTFHMLLPITLSVLRAVLVRIAGEPYAFPHNRIDRLLRVARADIHSLEYRQFIRVDDVHVGLVLAAQLLDVAGASTTDDALSVLLMSDATGEYGLIVDEFLGEQDLVVRPLDTRLGKVPNISAAAILDDGAPVLIADVDDLIRSTDQYIQTGTLKRSERQISAVVKSKRVLVVDDSITVREAQRQILRTHGYEVEVAVDGQDGWNKVRAEPFDLVISDVDMPRLNGIDFVRRIRDDPELRNLPVVIVSYKDREEDRLRGLEAGANYYLTKSSFHDHTFLDAVAALIGKAG